MKLCSIYLLLVSHSISSILLLSGRLSRPLLDGMFQQSATQCIDDETMDCAKLSTLFSICQDIQKAKSVCPRFCNLCGLVDGQWAHWTTWSECDVTCDKGAQTRTRSCTNPPPANGGLDCVGNKTETKICQRDACPVHDGWSGWSDWGSCSATCDIGLERRDRNCSNPLPSLFGEHCFGDAHEDRICHSQPCADGGWSDWSSWGSCSESCGGGIRSQTRTCSSPKPSILGTPCLGAVDRVSLCNKQTCPGDRIAFTAYGIASSSKGLRFPSVLVNYGGGYNSTSGILTAPTPGLYSFSVTVTQPSSVHFTTLTCSLYINNNSMILIYTWKATDDNESFQVSGTGTFHLNRNDIVYLSDCPSTKIQNGPSTFFSGILITPDM